MMNNSLGSNTFVLLPAASVALFIKDSDIRQAALSLKDDWRFARVKIEVIDGDVETAIDYYADKTSPDLLIVETLEITDGFSDRLDVLGGHCADATAAVVVGPVNDVYLYRKLIDMGVSDYLVKPLNADVLGAVFSKILTERLGAKDSHLIGCIGAKGGVGTSSLSYVLSDVLANFLGQKTVVLDAAGGWSYLSVAMGAESVTNLHEVARTSLSADKDSFSRMVVPVGKKLSFLATGAEPLMEDSVSADSFEFIINRLMQTYPVVVVDLSGASIDICRHILARANDIVVVSTPTLSSLRSARALIQEGKTIRGEKEDGIHIVLNQKGIGSGAEVSENDVAIALKMKPELVIPFLPKLFGVAESQGKLLSMISGGGEILSDVKTFLEKKIGIVLDKSTSLESGPEKSGLLGGLLHKMKKK